MGNTDTATEFVTTRDAATLCGVAPGTINRWVREGKLTPIVVGTGPTGTRFYRRSDVEGLS
jgi:DNA-binding transcriptional MerR regulator